MKSKAEYEEIIKDLNKACLKLIDEKSECEKDLEDAYKHIDKLVAEIERLKGEIKTMLKYYGDDELSLHDVILKMEKRHQVEIKKAKQETAEAILEKIKEHKNCYEYHIVNGKKNTCLDMILLWVLDEWLSKEKAGK